MALSTRKFGTTCPICKRFCFLSYIEIEEMASVGMAGGAGPLRRSEVQWSDLLRLESSSVSEVAPVVNGFANDQRLTANAL
jgi:hypothetical protein